MQERGAGPALTERDGRARRRALLITVAVAVAAVAIDQLTKWWALNRLDEGDIHVVWTLRLHLARNTGAAFSVGTGLGRVIPLLAVAVVAALIWSGRTLTSSLGAIGLGLVLGGAVGNLCDRVFRDGSSVLGGAVVDFVDLQWWPIFNVADAAVVVGALTLVLRSAREG